MSKRFYIILFCTLSLSVVLLGFSFARESGNNDLVGLANGNTDDFRVVYSNNQRLDTKDNDSVDISLVNKRGDNSKFYLVLEEVSDIVYENLYYTIDDGEKTELLNNEIYLGELTSFGTDGDFMSHSIKLINESGKELEFKLSIDKRDVRTLAETLKKIDNIYLEEEVNNYINYNDEVCRVVDIIDDKVKITCESDNDYELDNTMILVGGDGTKNNPYEVSYGS